MHRLLITPLFVKKLIFLRTSPKTAQVRKTGMLFAGLEPEHGDDSLN